MITINLEKKKIKHRNGEKRYILLFKGIIIGDIRTEIMNTQLGNVIKIYILESYSFS